MLFKNVKVGERFKCNGNSYVKINTRQAMVDMPKKNL